MQTAHIALVSLLAFIFVISGLAKASGNTKGLLTTRSVNVPDGFARVIGALEALAALGLIIGFRALFIQWIALVTLWVIMAGALYFHFRADKAKSAFPVFFLLTLLSFALVTI